MTSEINEKLQSGIKHQQDGNLVAAEVLYKEILEESPNQPDALHLLGVLAYQIGEYDVAEELITHAIESNNQMADYHNNLGEVLRVTHRTEAALEEYRIALSLDPDHENANQNLEKLTSGNTLVLKNKKATTPSEQIPQVRHALPSYLLSMDDEPVLPSQYLIDLSLLAASKASKIKLDDIQHHFESDAAQFINVWPGEHYRLLAALVDTLKPKLVIEIGTATGASALTMKKYLSADGEIITYDITPWNEYPGSGMQEHDFDAQLQQRLIDLSNPSQAATEYSTLEQADIIFADASKEQDMEQKFCELFASLTFKKPPLIIFDDIRVMPMLNIWRNIKHPKLDISSFGHWTGTGLVEWGK